MKILVIGDLHLTDQFDEAKYLLLTSIIKKADKVILNGDFYDGMLTSFDRFFNSDWKKLFPLLKTKKAIYIIGNHDYDALPRKETRIFSDKKVLEYEFTQDSKKFYITHGHLYGLTAYDRIKLFRQIKSLFWEHIYDYISGMAIRKYGKKALVAGSKTNKVIERNIRKKIPKEVCVIFSDTHYQFSNKKENIYNTGLFNHGIPQYIIVENGKVKLFDERY